VRRTVFFVAGLQREARKHPFEKSEKTKVRQAACTDYIGIPIRNAKKYLDEKAYFPSRPKKQIKSRVLESIAGATRNACATSKSRFSKIRFLTKLFSERFYFFLDQCIFVISFSGPVLHRFRELSPVPRKTSNRTLPQLCSLRRVGPPLFLLDVPGLHVSIPVWLF